MFRTVFLSPISTRHGIQVVVSTQHVMHPLEVPAMKSCHCPRSNARIFIFTHKPILTHHDKNEEADPGAFRISLLPILHSDMPGPPERKHWSPTFVAKAKNWHVQGFTRSNSPVRRWLLVPNLHRRICLYVCICFYIYIYIYSIYQLQTRNDQPPQSSPNSSRHVPP